MASVQGRIALGPEAGASVSRLGRGAMAGAESFVTASSAPMPTASPCMPNLAREKLEPLGRYAARPPLVHERLSLSTDGRTLL